MKPIEIKINSRIRCKGFDVSIGKRLDQVAIISHSTDEFTNFSDIRKGGRLAKIKRKFSKRICDRTCFFFDFMTEEQTLELVKMLK
jgi:hypothetical protein